MDVFRVGQGTDLKGTYYVNGIDKDQGGRLGAFRAKRAILGTLRAISKELEKFFQILENG